MVDGELPEGHELIRLLEARDWVVVAERTGFYVRLQPSLQAEHSVLVPTNPQEVDYATLLVAAIETEHNNLWSGDLQPKLAADAPTEEVSKLS
jgi:hypothetical protein